MFAAKFRAMELVGSLRLAIDWYCVQEEVSHQWTTDQWRCKQLRAPCKWRGTARDTSDKVGMEIGVTLWTAKTCELQLNQHYNSSGNNNRRRTKQMRTSARFLFTQPQARA
jgi:hypothetical protein